MKPDERRRWILNWIRVKGHGVDVLNREFVEDYVEATGAKHSEVFWGADRCPQLGRDLAKIAKEGSLTRARLGLGGNWQLGFPRWVWVYTIPEHLRQDTDTFSLQ